MRPLIWSVMAAIVLGVSTPSGAAAVDRYPQAASAYAVVIDGRLVWARAFDTPRAPASLTKLISALVLLEAGVDGDALVAVDREAAAAVGSRAGLRMGEVLTFGDALTAMLVSSANDACMALVAHVSRGGEDFAVRMNERARALGMTSSHFVQPCGLDAAGQQTTARDLLRLAAAAIANPEISSRALRPNAVISTIAGRRIELTASNLLLGREPGLLGLKSGFTNKAGKCLLAVARRGDHTVWIVLLDAPNRWWLATGMLHDAFEYAATPMLAREPVH
ncbi:MAG TPA: serine hydrolase [Steroidobacteraceae bacterium]|nr:serine hydrolase [Steroidobacteraceae bacterium]HRX90710.1 serine hydrolase [Steroidobacteraceae bacterium]